jgi:hypothetical protein
MRSANWKGCFVINQQERATGTVAKLDPPPLSRITMTAAIANAVYHATGTRIRSLPITPDKLL